MRKPVIIVLLIGFLFLLAAGATVVLFVTTDSFEAKVVEVTDSYTTRRRRAGSKHRRKTVYHEIVTVTYGDGKTAADIHIKQSSESSLPGVGDTVRLYRGPFGLRYYDPTSYIGTALGFLVAAVIVLIGGFRGIRVSSRKEPST